MLIMVMMIIMETNEWNKRRVQISLRFHLSLELILPLQGSTRAYTRYAYLTTQFINDVHNAQTAAEL
jgi:hypothetical protein